MRQDFFECSVVMKLTRATNTKAGFAPLYAFSISMAIGNICILPFAFVTKI